MEQTKTYEREYIHNLAKRINEVEYVLDGWDYFDQYKDREDGLLSVLDSLSTEEGKLYIIEYLLDNIEPELGIEKGEE